MENFSINWQMCANHYKECQCLRCEQNCPQQAIDAKVGIIDAERCTGCGICYAVCSTYAVEHNVDLAAILAAFDSKKSLQWYCNKQKAGSKLPCIAILPAKVLFSLAARMPVVIDKTGCAKCNCQASDFIDKLVIQLNNILPENSKIKIECSTSLVAEVDQAIDRRNFLKQLVGASVLFLEEVQQVGKVESRQLCNLNDYLTQNYSVIVSADALLAKCNISEKCTGCGLCAKLCPHHALRLTPGENTLQLKFSPVLCSNCKVCELYCPTKAINIEPCGGAAAIFDIGLPHCNICGKSFQPIANATICLVCNNEQKVLK